MSKTKIYVDTSRQSKDSLDVPDKTQAHDPLSKKVTKQ